MRKLITIVLTVTAVFVLLTSQTFGQNEKLAQTGFKFLSVSTDARVSGMSEAITSVEGYSSSMFFNPASMARLYEQQSYTEVSLGQTNWIADINYIHGSVAFTPYDGQYGVIGVSFLSVDYGDFQKTIRANNEKGYIDIGTYKPTAMMIGIGYAKALSEKFAIGGNVKYCFRDLGTHVVGIDPTGSFTEKSYSLDVMAFDFGILYKTGLESLNLGMSVRNFAPEIEYEEESFQLPLTFKIGLSANVVDFVDFVDPEMHSFLLSIDASHPRDYKEQLMFGGEYIFMDILALRGGYITEGDENGFTAGVGLQHGFSDFNFAFDYAYAPFGIFDDVHRISMRFGL